MPAIDHCQSHSQRSHQQITNHHLHFHNSAHSPTSTPASSPRHPLPLASSVLDWDEDHVHHFFLSLGLNRYQAAIREHGVTGDVLIHLDNELLKDIGISSVGKRLAILKAIYKLKLTHDIPIEDGHWVPPLGDIDSCESDESNSISPRSLTPQRESISRLMELRDQKIHHLESEIRSIKSDLQFFAAKLNPSAPLSPCAHQQPPNPSPTKHTHLHEDSIHQLDIPDHSHPRTPQSFGSKGAQTGSQEKNGLPKSSRVASSPTSPASVNTTLEPSLAESTPTPKESASSTSNAAPSTHCTTPTSTPVSGMSKDKDPNNPYKSFRVTVEDPCYKVLPAALKKYKIKEHYKNYVLFICYGRQERCLSYEEKPLLLFQKLKEAQQKPVFTLRHIRDIESPVSFALSKQTQRREKNLKPGSNASKKEGAGEGLKSPADQTMTAQLPPRPPHLGHVEPASGFCLAIYPYMSELGTEFEVGVGDTFLIVAKSKGWWEVVRDDGAGAKADSDSGAARGWIPSGCLIETDRSFASPAGLPSSPSASGADVPGPDNDGAANHLTPGTPDAPKKQRIGMVDYSTKIQPDNILSLCSHGVALMDYKAKNLDELSLGLGDQLKVYKKYNNWSYAINDSQPGKARGWAPSWLIGNRKERSSGSLGWASASSSTRCNSPSIASSGTSTANDIPASLSSSSCSSQSTVTVAQGCGRPGGSSTASSTSQTSSKPAVPPATLSDNGGLAGGCEPTGNAANPQTVGGTSAGGQTVDEKPA